MLSRVGETTEYTVAYFTNVLHQRGRRPTKYASVISLLTVSEGQRQVVRGKISHLEYFLLLFVKADISSSAPCPDLGVCASLSALSKASRGYLMARLSQS